MALDLDVTSSVKAKHDIKNSVFLDLFGDPNNVRKLYLTLHPDDVDVEIEDIQTVTHKSILVNDIVNDLSFTVRGKKLILLEAQSTWSDNIIYRMLLYVAQALHEYVKETEQDVFSSTLVKLPKLELYVLYTGDYTQKREYISFATDFQDGDSTYIDLRAKVLYGDGDGDIVSQYATFTRVLQQCIKELGFNLQAVKQAIAICKDKGVLKEYLEAREKEVITMFDTLFDQEYALKIREINLAKKIKAEDKAEVDAANARAEEANARADAAKAETDAAKAKADEAMAENVRLRKYILDLGLNPNVVAEEVTPYGK